MFTIRNIFTVMLLSIAMPTLADEPSGSAVISAPVTTSDALAALEDIFTAYSDEHELEAEAMVSPAMIGYQKLLDAMRLSSSRQNQIRISLHDTQMVIVDDVVVIHTSWEKRHITLPDSVPMLRKGQSIFRMQTSKEGWKLTGQSGDNVFSP